MDYRVLGWLGRGALGLWAWQARAGCALFRPLIRKAARSLARSSVYWGKLGAEEVTGPVVLRLRRKTNFVGRVSMASSQTRGREFHGGQPEWFGVDACV